MSDFGVMVGEAQTLDNVSGTVRDAEELRSRLNLMTEYLSNETVRVQKKLTRLAYVAFRDQSPVDTGAFKAEWEITINGQGFSGAPQIALSRVKLGDVVGIKNDSPYAMRLNRGWSKQAPAGWMDAIIEEVAQLALAGDF